HACQELAQERADEQRAHQNTRGNGELLPFFSGGASRAHWTPGLASPSSAARESCLRAGLFKAAPGHSPRRAIAFGSANIAAGFWGGGPEAGGFSGRVKPRSFVNGKRATCE